MMEEQANSCLQGDENRATWLQKYGYLLIFALFSVLIALVAFGGSPLYPINEWEDPNVFLTVGRSMLDGKVMYRDVYEQKGPYVYFLHAIAALISDTSFLGVWLLEIVNLFFVMLLCAKIIGLYGYKRSICVFSAILIAVSACFSYAMSTGDSVEEFTACLYLWLLYVTVKNIKNNQRYTKVQYLLIGVTAGVVFWTKFTLIGIYIGWFAYFVRRCIRRKECREIAKALLFVFLGVVIATLPCLIYFLAYGALKDWLSVYLYNNLFLYSDNVGFLYSVFNLFKCIFFTLVFNPHYALPMLFGVVWLVAKKQGEERWFLLWMILVTAFFLYAGGRGYRYYGLPLYTFVPFGYVAVLELLRHRKKDWLKRVGIGAVTVLLVSSLSFFFVNGRQYYIFRAKEDTAQYKVAQYVRENGDENSTIFTWGMLDSGFYLAYEQTPSFKYFSRFNIPLEEMYTEADRYLDEGLADYVVYCISEQNPEPFTHENYREVMRLEERSRRYKVTYYLYERK